MRQRVAAIALALTAAFVMVACGDNASEDAQPSTEESTFVDGVFDELPRHPRSTEAGERSETDGVIAQSFEVRNASPEQVLDWYTDRLEGWSMVGAVERLGDEAVRARWSRGDDELTVSATSGPTLGDDDEVVSQYSLSLDRG